MRDGFVGTNGDVRGDALRALDDVRDLDDGGDDAAPRANANDDDDDLYDAYEPWARSPWIEIGASPARENVFFA